MRREGCGSDEYRCGGWTPLYDAVGRGIGVLDEALDGKPGKADMQAAVTTTEAQRKPIAEAIHAAMTPVRHSVKIEAE